MGLVSHPAQSKQSFTLIELLIVIGILAILTAAVVIVLNPSELLKQGRDSTRMTDLASISKMIQLSQTQNPQLSLGTASTVYVSLPDTSASCSNLSLPALPTGYIYNCVPSASSTAINGNGWLPIDFSTSGLQILSKLPIDPTNSSSSSLYYTYTPNPSMGTYELTSALESAKYVSKEAQDGGVDPAQYEMGTNLTLSPFTHGLVGYWKFDEGSGTQALDSSGYGNTGNMYLNSSTIGDMHSISGCKLGTCVNLDGISNFVAINLNVNGPISLSLWFKRTGVGNNSVPRLIGKSEQLDIGINSSINYEYRRSDGSGTTWRSIGYSYDLNNWHMITFVFNNGNDCFYLDGSLVYQSYNGSSLQIQTTANPLKIGTAGPSLNEGVPGYIDDVKIYNRALSLSEVSAIYNASR